MIKTLVYTLLYFLTRHYSWENYCSFIQYITLTFYPCNSYHVFKIKDFMVMMIVTMMIMSSPLKI